MVWTALSGGEICGVLDVATAFLGGGVIAVVHFVMFNNIFYFLIEKEIFLLSSFTNYFLFLRQFRRWL